MRSCPALEAYREAAGMSQAAIAAKAGITRCTSTGSRAGNHDPTLGTHQGLVKALGVN